MEEIKVYRTKLDSMERYIIEIYEDTLESYRYYLFETGEKISNFYYITSISDYTLMLQHTEGLNEFEILPDECAITFLKILGSSLNSYLSKEKNNEDNENELHIKELIKKLTTKNILNDNKKI